MSLSPGSLNLFPSECWSATSCYGVRGVTWWSRVGSHLRSYHHFRFKCPPCTYLCLRVFLGLSEVLHYKLACFLLIAPSGIIKISIFSSMLSHYHLSICFLMSKILWICLIYCQFLFIFFSAVSLPIFSPVISSGISEKDVDNDLFFLVIHFKLKYYIL